MPDRAAADPLEHFHPAVASWFKSAFEAPTRMEWTGGLPFGLFVGRRTFTVTGRGDASEFRMHLRMTGPLAPLILKSVGDRQPEIDSFTAALKARALEHKQTVTIGRSHGIHAEPTTFGLKLAGHYAEFARGRARLYLSEHRGDARPGQPRARFNH